MFDSASDPHRRARFLEQQPVLRSSWVSLVRMGAGGFLRRASAAPVSAASLSSETGSQVEPGDRTVTVARGGFGFSDDVLDPDAPG